MIVVGMDAPPTLPPDVWDSLPPAVVALINWQAEQIRVLTARVAELEAKLGKKPTNSSKPPSTTHPHDKPPPKPKSARKRGGQPGHDKHERALIPSEGSVSRKSYGVCRPKLALQRRIEMPIESGGDDDTGNPMMGSADWLIIIRQPARQNIEAQGIGNGCPSVISWAMIPPKGDT